MSIEKDFQKFLKGNGRNIWLENRLLKVYLRKAKRIINHQWATTLDIGSISVIKQCKGTGTKMIKYFHLANPFEYTYIENVLTERFANKLRSLGWHEINEGRTIEIGDLPCFYKKVGEE